MIEPGLLFAGRYDLGPLIGQGGMAGVYAAHDTRLDRPVAVKLLRPDLAVRPAVRRRFEAEARLAARLAHPHVVSVFDSGEAGSVPYMVMERLSGSTLRDALAEGTFAPDDVRRLALEVLSALAAAHAAGIVHRDVKPGNILAAGGGHWKVADFGIAKVLEPAEPDATATAPVLGTPAYLAPERARGGPATARSDIYSLGVVLYEALAGCRPFDPAAPATVAAARPDVDPALGGAIERCLAEHPERRWGSAAELAAAISAEPTEVLPAPRRRARRNLVLAAAACAAALAAALASLFALGGTAGTPRVRPPATVPPTAPAVTVASTTVPAPAPTAPAPAPGPHGHGPPAPHGHGAGKHGPGR